MQAKKFRLKAAAGRYYQYTNDLTREDPMGGDQDFWTVADGATVPVSRADHLIGGASYETKNYLFDVEAYRKNLSGLTEFGMYRAGIRPPPPADDSNPNPGLLDFSRSFFTGTGIAQGVEVLVQKKYGSDTGWITYTLGKVSHYFPGISSASYPAFHDSTHEVKIVDSYSIKRFTFSGGWLFATGKPITEPTGSEELTTPDNRTFYRPTFGVKNGARLPNYHRLDLSASFDIRKGETNRAQAGVSIFNAYNHSNVWRRQYQIADGETIKTDVNYLGLTVSAFLNFNLIPPDLPPADVKRPPPIWGRPHWFHKSTLQAKPDKEFDLFGRIDSITKDRVTVRVGNETREFVLGKKAVLGEPNYEKGAFVHVYYQRQADQNTVTMLVRKIKNSNEIPVANIEPLDPLRPGRFGY